MSTQAGGPGPLISAGRLARALREARGGSGMTQAQAARTLHWSYNKVYRLENALFRRPEPADVRALSALYQLPPQQAADLETLAAAARRRPWYYPYQPGHPGLAEYLQAEHAAVTIWALRAAAVPGLLQTPRYAAALLTAAGDPDASTRLALLRDRQQILSGPASPALHVLISEAALHPRGVSPQVTADQAAWLRHAGTGAAATVRIIPAATAQVIRPATVIELGDRSAVVYDHGEVTTASHGTQEVAEFRDRLASLRAAAAPLP